MKKQTITISDLEKSCKHPFSELVGTACRFQSKILLSCGETQINAKSIMGVMALTSHREHLLISLQRAQTKIWL